MNARMSFVKCFNRHKIIENGYSTVSRKSPTDFQKTMYPFVQALIDLQCFFYDYSGSRLE